MSVHIALLRGVNVGGNCLKMERLRELCIALGCGNVRTYVQSGNVVLDWKKSTSGLGRSLEKQLLGETRLAVDVIIRTRAEMKKVLANNPFLKGAPSDVAKPVRHHVTFLASSPSKATINNLRTIKSGKDQFCVAGKDIYLFCPDGYGRTRISNNAIEKALGVRATTRNWNTVMELARMAHQPEG